MCDYVITCSSTCDLSKEYLKQNNNPYVKFSFLLGEEKYYDDFYDNISIEEFSEKIINCDVKTSQPDPAQYEEVWENILKEGKDVFHIELSSGISGAYASSLIIKDMLLEKYPDRKIVVIDSLCCSTGYGMLVMLANENKENFESIDEIKKYVEDMRLKINHIFIPNIEQLIKGGRIPAPIGYVAKAINIVPILTVNSEGKLEMLSKVRGMNKAVSEIENYILSNAQDGENYNYKFLATNILSKDIILSIFDDLKKAYKNAVVDENNIYNVGTVIGSHVGEGTIGLFFVGNERE